MSEHQVGNGVACGRHFSASFHKGFGSYYGLFKFAGVNASGKVETILADTNYKDTVGTASGIFDTFQQTGDFKDTNTISEKTVNGVLIENCRNTGSFDKQVDNKGAAFTHDICVHGSADAKPWTLRQGTLTFTNCTGKDGSQINVATEGV